ADPRRPRLLTEAQQTYNKIIRGIHGVCERANSLLKTTFKALRRVSLDPSRITQIAPAALVLLQLDYDRAI
ncbi:transposase family protein, partial [Streptomyces sp. NPDC002159]